MSIFADTSLLCALFRVQDNSPYAWSFMETTTEPVYLSSLIIFEFRQSVRLQAFRFSKDRFQGFSKKIADSMLAQLEENVIAGAFVIPAVKWVDVHSLAERLSAKHTFTHGHRTMDMLHIATALHIKAKTFFTFDKNQSALAKKEGFRVPTYKA